MRSKIGGGVERDAGLRLGETVRHAFRVEIERETFDARRVVKCGWSVGLGKESEGPKAVDYIQIHALKTRTSRPRANLSAKAQASRVKRW